MRGPFFLRSPRERLQQAWLHRGLLAWLLWPLSLLFRALTATRRAAYGRGVLRREHPGVPVIVVGNVVAGGAGKTPVVMRVIRHLQSRGLHPGVVSRGYGRETKGVREVLPGDVSRQTGDEPLLLRRATGVPVFVAERRIDAARALRARHPATDVIVCDDGLQHLALARDVEICVFDERGVGNGLLLPAGPLREPWPRPVDIVVSTASSHCPVAVTGFSAQRSLADHASRADGQRIPLDALKGRKLLALAGIARPEAFFAMLRARGLSLEMTMALPDHYDFNSFRCPVDAGYGLICTEKDAVKLWALRPDAWAVPLVVEPEPGFFQAIDRRLNARLSSLHGHQIA